MRQRKKPLFLSSAWTHAQCVGRVVSTSRDSCSGSFFDHMRAPRTRACTHREAISHHFYTTSQILTHVTMSSLLSPCRLHPFVPELTLLFPLFPYVPPPHTLRSSVTTAVCQLLAWPSLLRDEAEMQRGLQGRQLGPSFSPSCHSHFRLPLIIKASFFLHASSSVRFTTCLIRVFQSLLQEERIGS